ncbi:hypothetical protein [Mesorhizobium sp. L2C067A000]|uniref:hypothetical protein n=1 Tax=Mesorhizobium sp. L2C067A000 TaxID=1287106 RepID=UPI0003D02321|nr:hypothetical protein [Mesorhizobium sp. L2C067A000]ESZ37547.1 hypothetical protein X733_03320 [Mesorhizobium sp. L2C067A000]
MGDTELIAIGAKFRTAWAAERAAFVASGKNFDKDAAIETAAASCGELAGKMLELPAPVTIEGARAVAMVWGWTFYLSEKPGEYEGADSQFPGERAANAVMSFLLKDCAA